MKSNRNAARCERRAFSAEFKAEAVRLVTERRAEGATLAQVGRESDGATGPVVGVGATATARE